MCLILCNSLGFFDAIVFSLCLHLEFVFHLFGSFIFVLFVVVLIYATYLRVEDIF